MEHICKQIPPGVKILKVEHDFPHYMTFNLDEYILIKNNEVIKIDYCPFCGINLM